MPLPLDASFEKVCFFSISYVFFCLLLTIIDFLVLWLLFFFHQQNIIFFSSKIKTRRNALLRAKRGSWRKKSSRKKLRLWLKVNREREKKKEKIEVENGLGEEEKFNLG